MLLQLGVEVRQVDGAVVGSLNHHNAQVRQGRRRRVRAVRGRRDKADVALGVAVCHVVPANGQQARQLAGGAGVRLHGHFRVTGDLHKPGADLIDQFAPARGELVGRVRVHVGETRPRDGLEARRRVELHGARPERDHRAVQGEVLVAEGADVAHHLRFGVDAVERLVGEERGVTRERGGDAGVALGRRCAEALQEGGDVGIGGVLAEGHAHGRLVDCAHEVARGSKLVDDLRRPLNLHRDRVEEVGVFHLHTAGLQRRREVGRALVHGARDVLQALRAVVDRVHRRRDSQQRLRGADV